VRAPARPDPDASELPRRPARRLPRVGALVDGPIVPAWTNDVLTPLGTAETLDLVGVWACARTVTAARVPLAVRGYESLDRRRYGRETNALDLRGPIVAVESAPPQGSTPLDVLVDLRTCPTPGDPATLSATEWWWLELEPAGEPPLWEAMRAGTTTCDVRLVVQRPHGTGLARASTVGITPASLTVSRNTAFGRAAELVVRQLSDLGAGTSPFVSTDRPDASYRRSGPAATTRTVVGVAAARTGTALRHARERRTREQWIVGLRRAGNREPTDGTGYVVVPQPPDREYADPFLASDNGRTFLFFEDFSFGAPHATISASELGSDGTVSAPAPVLARPYHLSYPFVFRMRGAWFMIPETASNRAIELYRASSFPTGWELESVLLHDVAARDTTLLQLGDLLWLFTCIDSPNGGRHDELHVFWSDRLDGAWAPHPRNPVVSDVRAARPAGAVFSRNGELVRPAQDCSVRYGGATVFRVIDKLDRDDYEEHTAGRLDPIWAAGLHGTHTYNRSDEFEVVDGARMVRPRNTHALIRRER
jgi:hypothetical protein